MTDAAELQYLREFKRHALAVFEKYLNTPESRALRQLAFEIERERLILVSELHNSRVGKIAEASVSIRGLASVRVSEPRPSSEKLARAANLHGRNGPPVSLSRPSVIPRPKPALGGRPNRNKPEDKDDRTEAQTPDPCSVGNFTHNAPK